MIENNDIIDILVAEWKQERPELDVEAMQVIGRIIKLGKILEKSASHALLDSGIHYTDLDVLATIRRSGKPYALPPKQLMKSVLITSGAMTALLDRLTKLELIYRAPDIKDGRIKLAGLTKKGMKIIDEAIKIRFSEAKSTVKVFNKTEHAALSKLLKKLLLSLESEDKIS
ncbi:MarR family winged helix-turn-helix transcriptional regulator [Aquimarina megaterium]|uniref:MarR family winged helix-turn-helix transcriptional regulator n=1 Tax=Aquimarina megaterium TaxID=1443666 RepID=UPI0009423B21|nr:MarR family transcriptional regulator [Aquimarina megaterium]